MDYIFGYDLNIIEKNDNNMNKLINENNLNRCEWHSSWIPTINDMECENRERKIYSSKKYNGYDDEIQYKFIYDINKKICYDNCNYKNRLDEMTYNRKLGEKIINDKKPEILELDKMKSNVEILLEKNKKLIKANEKILKELNIKKSNLEETKLITQIRKINSEIEMKNKENENLKFVTNQLKDKINQIEETYKNENYDELLNMDPVILGQLHK